MLPPSVGDWHGDCPRRSMTALSGAYFVGSIALGGYVANGSDVDIVGVSERDAPGSWSSKQSSRAQVSCRFQPEPCPHNSGTLSALPRDRCPFSAGLRTDRAHLAYLAPIGAADEAFSEGAAVDIARFLLRSRHFARPRITSRRAVAPLCLAMTSRCHPRIRDAGRLALHSTRRNRHSSRPRRSGRPSRSAKGEGTQP